MALILTATNQTQTYGFGGTSSATAPPASPSASSLVGKRPILSGVTLTTNDPTSHAGEYIATSGVGTANTPASISPASGQRPSSPRARASNYAITYANASIGLTVNQATW